MPYRGDAVKKFSYHRCEDSLIALGLDQFWDYVENNRDIYKPKRCHPRHRWGLNQVCELVSKHMMPWYTPRMLISHINFVRKHGDKDNPINKFFNKREIEPVLHKLLPFSPELTLYEQPEHEMPRLWVRYLAKSSKRFRDHFYKRAASIVGLPLNGVAIDTGKLPEAPKKDPLPIHFTKVFRNCRDVSSLAPPNNDRVDLIINRENKEANGMITISINTINNDETDTEHKKNFNTNNIFDDDSNELVINENIDESNKINKESINNREQEVVADVTPNTQHIKIYTAAEKVAIANKIKDGDHCQCCIMLRNICKQRQTMITEFFRYRNSKIKMSCPCREKRPARISNKLRLLTNLHKSQSKCMFRLLLNKLKLMRHGCDHNEVQWLPKFDFDDIAFVISYQMRLNIRTGIAKNNYIKQRIHNLLSKFDPDNGNPVNLAEDVFKAFKIELVDMYQEFLGFLTAEQADQIGHFRDYFVHTCMPELVKKVEEQVHDRDRLSAILSQLHKATVDKVSTACDTCSRLLCTMEGLPELARYTFSLFPHSRKDRCKTNTGDMERHDSCNAAESHNINDVLNSQQLKIGQMKHEIDDSNNKRRENVVNSAEKQQSYICSRNSNNEVIANAQPHGQSMHISDKGNLNMNTETLTETPSSQHQSSLQTAENVTHDNSNSARITQNNLEIDTPQLIITKTEIQYDSCDESSVMSTMVMSDDESIKSEVPDWTRDEDKLILEILKDNLTPEDIKDKTILEILVEKNMVKLISESLDNKSVEDIQSRVLYLLQLLVVSDK